jgi:hypothetical protein
MEASVAFRERVAPALTGKEDRRVSKAILELMQVSGWPYFFAKNIVLWRKAHGFTWETWL